MKLEDLAYAIAQKVFNELEHKHHFKVPDDIRKVVSASVQENLGDLLA
jgi:hypothetical protein